MFGPVKVQHRAGIVRVLPRQFRGAVVFLKPDARSIRFPEPFNRMGKLVHSLLVRDDEIFSVQARRHELPFVSMRKEAWVAGECLRDRLFTRVAPIGGEPRLSVVDGDVRSAMSFELRYSGIPALFCRFEQPTPPFASTRKEVHAAVHGDWRSSRRFSKPCPVGTILQDRLASTQAEYIFVRNATSFARFAPNHSISLCW